MKNIYQSQKILKNVRRLHKYYKKIIKGFHSGESEYIEIVNTSPKERARLVDALKKENIEGKNTYILILLDKDCTPN